MMKCACVTIHSFCVLPLFFVCHICQKPNRSLSSSSSFVTNAFKFDHSQCQPVSQSVSHSRSQSIVQLYLKYQFMHGNYSGFFLFCFVLLAIYSSISVQRQHISSVPFTRSRSHAEQFRNFYSAISLCSSSFYSARCPFFSSNHSFDLSFISHFV